MDKKDFHSKPFGESTLAKLEIFEDYTEAWLPTFIMQQRKEIHIFDFFSGTGYDKLGRKGSPIRIIDKVAGQIDKLFKYGLKITLHFNEFQPNRKKQEKFNLLRQSCESYLELNPKYKQIINLNLYNKDFEVLFFELYKFIKSYASLVFLDQCGVKYLSDKYLLSLEKCLGTDFIYFTSSSYFKRFGDHEYITAHVKLNLQKISVAPYNSIHRTVLDEFKAKLPENTKLKLYPFSLKKGANIHGIIFGATNIRGVDKFLTIAWNRDKISGEANFDIHSDVEKDQLDLFQPKQEKKVEIFKKRIKNLILGGVITNNQELYIYSLDCGHIGSHAKEVLMELKKKKLVFYDANSPLVTYDQIYKKHRILDYKIK